ncbi:MAG: hypothetical protein NC913_07970 [Candidatus Omnitrophica bacterium]|nr:hypothetical protein [Candidatus Omnitrophota bacterium]
MKRTSIIVGVLLLFLCCGVSVLPATELYVEIRQDDILIATKGALFAVSSDGIHSAGYMMYFAAKDFTANKDLTMGKLKEAKLVVDKPDRKVVKAVFMMENQKNVIDNDYQHVLFLEMRKGYPFLAVDSRFTYLGEGTHVCGINWGMEGSSDANKFKYFAYPEGGKILNFKMGPLKSTQSNKIGVKDWLYAHDGKGYGAGLICAGLLARGEDFIFINSVPQKKQLKKGNFIEVFFITMPISKNFKILQEIFDEIKTVKWVYE